MRHDAVIFDIDGTLWDASQTSADGWNIGLAKMGIENRISAAGLRTVTGNPYEICIDLLLPGLRSQYPDLLKTLNDCEMTYIKCRGGDFYDGVIEGLKELSRKFKLFLVSNCQDWYLDLFMGFSGVKDVFTGFACHGATGLSKAQMIHRVKKDYHLKRPVYFGDTAGDEAAAKFAGVEFIHVSWGFGKPISDPKSVATFKELVEYLHDN